MQRFRAKLTAIRGGGHHVVVPPEVAEAAGLRYGARVRGTVDGAPYRSSLMKSSGVFHLGVHKATIAAAGAASGDEVDVRIELDDEPLPADTVPADLARALGKTARLRAAWANLPPSHRREHVKHVVEAKQPETRARRIAATVAALAGAPGPARAGRRCSRRRLPAPAKN